MASSPFNLGPLPPIRRSVVDPATGNVTLGPHTPPSALDLGGAYIDLLAGRAKDAVTAPRDAYTGDLQVFDPATGHVSAEAVERAGGMAGLAMTGSLALPVPQGALRMFGGRNAATADLAALGQAEKMAGKGANRADILDETGWFRGTDGGARFEISDDAARLSPFPPTAEAPLGLVLDHPALYAAYPEMRDVSVYHRPEMGRDAGANPDTNLIALNLKDPDALSSLLHEAQHMIQAREGFARGGAPSDFAYGNSPLFAERKVSETAVDAYRRLAGETEARNVQMRQSWSQQDRLDAPAWITEDIPLDQQIIKLEPELGPAFNLGPLPRKGS